MVWACLNKGVYQICVLSSRFLVSLLCAALAFLIKTQKFKHTLRDLPTNRINFPKMKNFWVLKLAYGLPSGLQQYKGIQPILIQINFAIYKRSKEHKNYVLADQNKASGIFMHQVNQIKILKLKLGAYRLQIRQFSKNHFFLRSLFDGIYYMIYDI